MFSQLIVETVVGDSHEGPLKNLGESCLKPAKNAKRKPNLGPNAKYTHNTIHAAVAPAAYQSGPAKRPLERGPEDQERPGGRWMTAPQ
jgi:hypothetical protein